MPNKKPLPIDAPDDHIRPDLDKLVAKWQRILRLQDWDVKARYIRASDLDGDWWAQCDFSVPRNFALIDISEPSDVPASDEDYPLDVERFLVHELRHISEAAAKQSEDSMERHIDMDATILVTLDRATIK